ncbi:winged helix-turn-helix domain-containing protein (plasmid) [Streptomyces sp. JL4002]|uniref:winged helix-turn-helix domain-containing protein n=1 Tax=Streptomyces sp. JL4002 TaxID=3404781 RepID=UPI003B28363F
MITGSRACRCFHGRHEPPTTAYLGHRIHSGGFGQTARTTEPWLGWSLQRPERRAVERDESEIARWIAHEWPRIKKGP